MLVAQSCPTLCNPMDWSSPGSSVHGILQARILEWVTIPLSRGSSQPRDWTRVSCIEGRFFTVWATREDCLMSFISSHIQFIWISLIVSNMSFHGQLSWVGIQKCLHYWVSLSCLLSLLFQQSSSLHLFPPCNWFVGKSESFAPKKAYTLDSAEFPFVVLSS